MRHPQNADGPFYVMSGECMSCGAPEAEGPELISHDASDHCFFARQPADAEETNSAIRAIWVGSCGALRYGGGNPEILRRFAELGESSRCDVPLHPPASEVRRNCARFRFKDWRGSISIKECVKLIVEVLAAELVSKRVENSCSDFRYEKSSASFKYDWGVLKYRCSIRFHVKHIFGIQWLIRITKNDDAEVGFSIRIDGVMQRDPAFQDIQWFTQSEFGDLQRQGTAHPY